MSYWYKYTFKEDVNSKVHALYRLLRKKGWVCRTGLSFSALNDETGEVLTRVKYFNHIRDKFSFIGNNFDRVVRYQDKPEDYRYLLNVRVSNLESLQEFRDALKAVKLVDCGYYQNNAIDGLTFKLMPKKLPKMVS